jgi:hypothetical protein
MIMLGIIFVSLLPMLISMAKGWQTRRQAQ